MALLVSNLFYQSVEEGKYDTTHKPFSPPMHLLLEPPYMTSQYCCEMQSVKDLSLDHVVPRSKGGKLTWTNTVTACLSCNSKKGQTQVQDLPKIGMKLRMLPRVPSNNELQSKAKIFKKYLLHPHWSIYVWEERRREETLLIRFDSIQFNSIQSDSIRREVLVMRVGQARDIVHSGGSDWAVLAVRRRWWWWWCCEVLTWCYGTSRAALGGSEREIWVFHRYRRTLQMERLVSRYPNNAVYSCCCALCQSRSAQAVRKSETDQ